MFLIATEKFEESQNVFGGIAYPAHKYGRVIYEAARCSALGSHPAVGRESRGGLPHGGTELKAMVGPTELESVTSCVSSRRSNQLSYGPSGVVVFPIVARGPGVSERER